MSRAITVAAVLLVAAASALAGEVYGKITEGTKPVGEGIAVQITCAGKTAGPVKTDKASSYHLMAPAAGKCTLSVSYKQQTPSVEIVSYDEGTEADLVLELKDGSYTLRRK